MKIINPSLSKFRRLAVAIAVAGGTSSAIAAELMLEEVIVTAQKREQNLQDVPVAVTAVDSQTIEQLGILTTADVVRITPSMTVQQSNNKTNSSFRIRGVGTDVFGIGVEQAVAMIVDDVAMVQQGQAMASLADIERIEVLRGPQSTLFGKAASAGVINIVTKDPSEEFEGTLEATWTDESEQRLLGSISGPITDTLGYRLTGNWYDHDGWGKNLTPGEESTPNFSDGFGVRAKLKWDITDTISATLIGHLSEEDSDCCARSWRDFDTENGRIFGGVIPEPPAEGIKPDDDNTTIRRDTPANGESDSEGVSLRLSFDLGEFSLVSISAYDKWEYGSSEDVDFSDIDVKSYLPFGTNGGFYSNSYRELEFMSQEFRLISPSYDNYDYLIGFYYSDTDVDRTFLRDLPLAPNNFAASSGNESIALFGQLNWHITEKTTASLGLRAFEEEISASAQDFASGAETPTKGDDSDSDVIGKLSLQHAFTDNVMAFISYAEGYKGQAFDINDNFDEFKANNPAEAETSDAWELGLKSTLWENRMQFNLTAFHTIYENFQVQSTGLNDDGIAFFRLDNAGEVETQGLELETVTLLSEAFTLTFNAAYIDAEVNDFTGAACYSGQTSDTGCDPESDSQTIDGGTLPNTPEWKYTAMLDYYQVLDSLSFDFFANVVYTWQDDIRFNIDQNPLTVQDSYGITNLRIGVRDKSDRYELTAFVNNLFDEGYVGDMLDSSRLYFGTSVPAILHMVPRNSQQYWGIKAKFNF